MKDRRGAFIPQEDGSWLLFREKDIALLDFDRHSQVVPLVENVRVDGDRFNDAIADVRGACWWNHADGTTNGAGIYRLEVSGTLAKVLVVPVNPTG